MRKLTAMQEVLTGPHTRVRVDTVAAAQVSPQGKKHKDGRQMGLASFYKGEGRPPLSTFMRLPMMHEEPCSAPGNLVRRTWLCWEFRVK